MLTDKQLRRAKRALQKERTRLIQRARASSSVLNPSDERDTDEADIVVNIQTRAQELWARDGWERRLYEIERAMKRLEEGEYGKCEVCGAEIDRDRLEILPETTMCVHCRERFEKSSHAAEWMDRAGLFDFDSSDVALETGLGDDAESSIDLGNDDDDV